VKEVRIEIGCREYFVDLVVLPGLEIDVILGIKWMSGNGVLIDTSTRVVTLRDPVKKEAYHFLEILTSTMYLMLSKPRPLLPSSTPSL
jgi:hypothetical protein